MRITFSIIFVFNILFLAQNSFSQQKPPSLPGIVKGEIRDTLNNYVLKSATISIFRERDSILLGYRISNIYGEFEFTNLPVDIKLKLEASHVGYVTISKKFSIPKEKPTVDFKT